MFGEKLKRFGKDQFGSVKDLALALEILPQQLSTYISETKKPGFELLARLRLLGCDVNALLDDAKSIGEFSEVKSLAAENSIQQEARLHPPPTYPSSVDIRGALELTGMPGSRLAPLLHISRDVLISWADGKSQPDHAQLALLFNATVALGLVRVDTLESVGRSRPVPQQQPVQEPRRAAG